VSRSTDTRRRTPCPGAHDAEESLRDAPAPIRRTGGWTNRPIGGVGSAYSRIKRSGFADVTADQTGPHGHTELASWTAEDSEAQQEAIEAFRRELDGGMLVSATLADGSAEVVRELPFDADLVVLRRRSPEAKWNRAFHAKQDYCFSSKAAPPDRLRP
jgi:hypothetical protein